MLDTLDGMQEELRALRDAERGTLTLAASTTPGSYVLPSILECFAERHPRVDVDVVIGSSRWVAERVARREVSLGLAGEVDWPDGVLAEPFLDDEVIGIAAPGRLRAARRARSPLTSWRRRRCWCASRARARARSPSACLARVGYRPAKRWELDSNEAIKRSVRAGLGIGFVSRLVVEEELDRGELEAFAVAGRRADAALGLPAAPRRARARAGRARVHRDALLVLRGQRRRLHGRRGLARAPTYSAAGKRRIAHLLWEHDARGA